MDQAPADGTAHDGATRRSPFFDVVVGLNYYWPYVSGLSELARMTAEQLAARGLRVRVVTSQYDPSLPRYEMVNGVEVERTRVVLQVRNGVVSPMYPVVLARRIRQSRVAHLHLPMLEAGGVAALVARHPMVVTYHCDYQTTDDLVGQVIRRTIDASSRAALRLASRVVVTSEDYAVHSRVYGAMRDKTVAIPPPFRPRGGGQPSFRRSEGLHVGFLGRIVEEKGLDYLIRAFREIDDPAARLLIAGGFAEIAGQSVIDQLRELSNGDERIAFLGFLPEEQVADFFASIDVFAFPSVNPLEAFGIVQLEALSAGVPVVASDLPGVRLPVIQSGIGKLVTPRHVEELRQALVEMGSVRARATGAPFGADDSADRYETLFKELAG